jgi:hypothetical protein
MASRSTVVILVNATDHDLQLTHATLQHGIWSDEMYPPLAIAKKSRGQWESESDGFMTGTEGSATWHLAAVGQVKITWDNPYVGSNSYSQSAPKKYKITHDGGSGDNATVTFTLVHA